MNSPPSPSLLRKEGVQYFVLQALPPLYRAERKELALWASLVRRQTAEVAGGKEGGEFMKIELGEKFLRKKL